VTNREEQPELLDEDEVEQEDLMPSDPEVPEADALDQARTVGPAEHRGRVSRAIDAPDADAIEQATEVPIEPDEEVT
jgi:hypothetical protein